jgi:hypothetical protein
VLFHLSLTLRSWICFSSKTISLSDLKGLYATLVRQRYRLDTSYQATESTIAMPNVPPLVAGATGLIDTI